MTPEEDDTTSSKLPKKSRLFLAKEFRSKLKTSEKLPALQHFLTLCTEEQDHDYIFEYLENGGSCLEMFQTLDLNSEIPPSLVLEVVNLMLLRIISNYPHFMNTAHEACRYFLNTHMALINKMLALSSTSKERQVILSLLSVMVTHSHTLAKEILLHVNFNQMNLEVLAKQTGQKDSVRSSFINFVISFLVDGHYPTIALLLEKKDLLMSIINGLQYDPAQIVCMVLVTLKTNILQNQLVSKTSKMGIFSTPVIKDIVNLYNWKGPEGFNARKALQAATVNEADKTQVNEAVHDFLLVLCTSHTFGVIFKDHQLGFGKKNHNNLMVTVLESLEKPWEHSYAGELVAKICGACPDLARIVWNNLKSFLEPRATKQWYNAIKYVKTLVQELKPSSIEFCVKEFSAQQVGQAIISIIAPTSILKIIIPEGFKFEKPVIKHKVLITLLEILKVLQAYSLEADRWFKLSDSQVLKRLLNEHVLKYFPQVQLVLNNWQEARNDEQVEVLEHLEVIIELIEIYESSYPQFLENLNEINLNDLLDRVKEQSDETKGTVLQMRVIKFFIAFEPNTFIPGTELFNYVFPLVLNCYFEMKNPIANQTLRQLLQNTGIFEDNLEEVDVWINAVFDLSALEPIPGVIVAVVNQTFLNLMPYLSSMSRMREKLDVNEEQDNRSILEAFFSKDCTAEGSFGVKSRRGISPLLLGTLEYLSSSTQHDKAFRNYLSSVIINLLHSQASYSFVESLICDEKYQNLISKHVLNYVTSFRNDDASVSLTKTKAHVAQALCTSFLRGDMDEFFEQHKELLQTQAQYAKSCFNQVLFYFTNLNEALSELHLVNLKKYLKNVMSVRGLDLKELLQKVFLNPVLLHRFSVLRQGKSRQLSTEFLTEVVREYKNVDLSAYLKPFREKITEQLKKTLAKPDKNLNKGEKLHEVLQVFGLEHQQCLDILLFCVKLPDVQELSSGFIIFYYKLLTYALSSFMHETGDAKPLQDEVVVRIQELLTFLNSNPEHFDTSNCANVLRNYLQVFPSQLHLIESKLFKSILVKIEFCKDNALLANFLLTKRAGFLDLFKENLNEIASKKGLMLSLLDAAIAIQADEKFLRDAYTAFEPSILKCLEKPQKAGQHFETYKPVVIHLVTKFMAEDTCRVYVEKVHKFDVSEPFHVEILTAIFSKFCTEEFLNNSLLTLVGVTNNLFKRKGKLDESDEKLNSITCLTVRFLKQVSGELTETYSYRTVCKNNAFQLYCKFCLKFGLSGEGSMIEVLKYFTQFLNFEEAEARLLLEMCSSHSEFLELLLSNDSKCKTELLDFMLVLFQRWPNLMERNHIPVLLAAYGATMRSSDRIILMLLQMYENRSNKTDFNDFKPFLWGTAAATHYSVRQNIQSALWRQPKMRDILDILDEEQVLNTIIKHPLNSGLTATKTEIATEAQNTYDLSFFMPLFSSLLAPENEVAIYKFPKSGALSLTVVALSSNNKELRQAACHVLARWYYHVEARQSGKNKPLWLRYVEALCRGTAGIEDFKLNNFAAIFWAKMALILTQPFLSLYLPLSYYLGAKATPNLNNIPELYTFLHDSHVNYKDTRLFILEILRDGLRTANDFSVALNAMAFKLVMELYSSCISDTDTKVLVLEIFSNACKIDSGAKMLCSSFGLLSWLYQIVLDVNSSHKIISPRVVSILNNITSSPGSEVYASSELVTFIKELATSCSS